MNSNLVTSLLFGKSLHMITTSVSDTTRFNINTFEAGMKYNSKCEVYCITFSKYIMLNMRALHEAAFKKELKNTYMTLTMQRNLISSISMNAYLNSELQRLTGS